MAEVEQTTFERLFQQALDFHKQGNLERAETLYCECLLKMPGHGESLFNLGMVYTSLNRYKQAIEYYEYALQVYPDEPKVHYNLAIAQVNQQDFSSAVYHLQQVLIHEPLHANANHLLACIHYGAQQWADAKRHFEQALALLSEDASLHANYAICCLHEHDLSTAIKHLERAVELEEEAQSLYNLAFTQELLGETTTAIKNYHRALALENDFNSHHQLALLYQQQANTTQAQKHAQEALKLDNNNPSMQFIISLAKDNQPHTLPNSFVSHLFDHYSDHYEQHLQQTLKYQLVNYFAPKLDEIINRPIARAIDIGCGTGLAGNLLQKYSQELIGIDLSSRMLTHANQKRIYQQLEHAEAINYLQNNDSPFDLIFAIEVLNYIGKLDDFFELAQQRLTSTGTLWFSIEQGEDDVQFKHNRFTHNETYIEQLLAKNNFKIRLKELTSLRQQNDSQVRQLVYVVDRAIAP